MHSHKPILKEGRKRERQTKASRWMQTPLAHTTAHPPPLSYILFPALKDSQWGHFLITNHFFQSMLFNLAMLDRAHPFRWRERPLRGQANNAQQPPGLTGVICQALPACLWWSHRWIYPKVNGDSPRRPRARHSDYRPSPPVALIDVACVYLFTMLLNLWIQCNMGRRGPTQEAE